jgi:hypothetical protein
MVLNVFLIVFVLTFALPWHACYVLHLQFKVDMHLVAWYIANGGMGDYGQLCDQAGKTHGMNFLFHFLFFCWLYFFLLIII